MRCEGWCEAVENKLDFLFNQANIGTYNKCEIIEIFGKDKINANPFNIFTLIIFENTKKENIKEFLFDKLQKFNSIKGISWGVQRRIVDISSIEKLYNELINANIFNIDNSLDVGSLKLLPEQYIQPEDSFSKPQLNYILKNNFKYGSYILEFFDEDKSHCQFLFDNPEILNDFNEKLNVKLPIEIGNIFDRLGNVVFQFPINNFSMIWSIKKNKEKNRYEGLKFDIEAKNSKFDINNLLIRVHEENDNTVTRQRLVEVKDKVTEIDLDDCYGTTVEIFDKNSSLLLYKNKFNIMKESNFNVGIVSHQKRVFSLNGKTHKIQVSHNSMARESKQKKEYIELIQERKYDQELKELEKSRAFIQYFGNEKEKALNDIRKLINRYGEKGVYLWDPYLNANDIKNTLYHCSVANVPMKAISRLGHSDAKKYQKESFKKEMIDEFEKDSREFLLLNLEIRGIIGSNGYDFHDRFLIFPLEKPKVWSLGISVNQLGASHHILQEVKHTHHILNAFNDLWEKLDREECLVWKSR